MILLKRCMRFLGFLLGGCGLFLACMLTLAWQITAWASFGFFSRERAAREAKRGLRPFWWGLRFLCFVTQAPKVLLKGAFPSKAMRALVLSNHQSYVDVILLVLLAQKQGAADGMYWFAKAELKHLPIIGWGFALSRPVFLERNWAKDQFLVDKALLSVKACTRFWLMLFPEGSRMSAKNLRASKKSALSRGLPTFDHVLAPKPMGFVRTISAVRSRLDTVADLLIYYPEGAPTVLDYFLKHTQPIEIRSRLIPVAEIPESADNAKKWLWKLFEAKEQEWPK
jgi:1-acyl-sn-glycerol-3-phosphate acyltransferase